MSTDTQPLKVELTYPALDARITEFAERAIENGGRIIITFPNPHQEDWDRASDLEDRGELTILYTEMAIEARYSEDGVKAEGD